MSLPEDERRVAKILHELSQDFTFEGRTPTGGFILARGEDRVWVNVHRVSWRLPAVDRRMHHRDGKPSARTVRAIVGGP